jgi:hypothetical protein
MERNKLLKYIASDDLWLVKLIAAGVASSIMIAVIFTGIILAPIYLFYLIF